MGQVFVFQTRKVSDILLTAQHRSQEWALVLFMDGGYGFTRDGNVLSGYYWTDGQLDACLEVFMQFAGIEIETPQDSSLPSDHRPL